MNFLRLKKILLFLLILFFHENILGYFFVNLFLQFLNTLKNDISSPIASLNVQLSSIYGPDMGSHQ
jgi:hypothetical protein